MSDMAAKSSDKSQAAQAETPKSERANAGRAGSHEAVLALQGLVGNRAVAGLLLEGSGRPLDPATREEMESKFGEDFRDVRVHSDRSASKSAAALGANAWTMGTDVVFGEGLFSPGSTGGKKLLAHELAHVVQQRRGGVKPGAFDSGSASEHEAASVAAQSTDPGPLSVNCATGTGVAREEAESPWWKQRLNPIYQRALAVLPKEAAEKLEQVNAAAKELVSKTGTSDESLNQAVQAAEPVLQPIADYLGVKSPPAPKATEAKPITWLGAPPIDVQLQQRREQKQAQAALDQSDPGAFAPPTQHQNTSELPPFDVMMRPDPVPTDFEAKLKAGKHFETTIHPKPELDPRKVHWAGRRPTDEQMKHMRFEDVNNPSRRVWVDEGKGVGLGINPDDVMAIRDRKTNELRGYRYRQGDTMTVLDRNGEVVSNRNLEAPLEHPAIDPIDAAMLAVDLAPLAAKGIQAGSKALIEMAMKSGVREASELGGDEASQLLAREALNKGVSHPREFPELDFSARPANDVDPIELPTGRAVNDGNPLELPAGRPRDTASHDNVFQLDEYRPQVPEEVEQEALRVAEGQDFQADRTVATAGGRGGGSGPTLKAPAAPGRTTSGVGTRSARTATGAAAPEAVAEEGPTIARFGKDEIVELTAKWQKDLASEQDPARVLQIRRYIKALNDKTRIRDWRQSEDEMAHLYSQIGGKGETTFEVEAEGGLKRITKPDIDAPNVRGEVKNWEILHIKSEETPESMLKNLTKQVEARRQIPNFKDQTVILDLRGQKLTEAQLQAVGKTLSERTGLPPKNIQIVTWAK